VSMVPEDAPYTTVLVIVTVPEVSTIC
jgi:hypothetical protein